MVKRRFYPRGKRKIGIRKNMSSKNIYINKFLIQLTISCIIVLMVLGIKANIFNTQKYLNNIVYILEYNEDFTSYISTIKKKTAEVFKLYDEDQLK
ncbi:hypothetical protein SAMN05661008_01967 [Alkalithermobacter thermoalcaliphilus JW-YL-7 = DSM 7308]|uniref:Uncharacterized protein n=1 Tax=Alkalithermobacter thermoalcaliphilus JW-YL-7 = DSM 7308 TaxID=1121328 RepID=A0A150FRA6_CLOPD|nr:hypothetical protein JWYL7_1218 [[Clostridium] paradoxum JW-YL-7 = DSM 7308]SHL38633.1 hypothetical protein SAMN05661008_01967 [[Clostridium] paradoxum JW-YL-7 = DSM 7308]